MGTGNVARDLERFPPLDFHPSPSMMASRFAADQAIRKQPKEYRPRPSRWAYRIDFSECCRADLIHHWRAAKSPAPGIPAGRIYFHEGRGCTTSPKYKGREGREVLTLRDLLKVARIDYVGPVVVGA